MGPRARMVKRKLGFLHPKTMLKPKPEIKRRLDICFKRLLSSPFVDASPRSEIKSSLVTCRKVFFELQLSYLPKLSRDSSKFG